MHLLKTFAPLLVLTQLAACTIVSEPADDDESPGNKNPDAGEPETNNKPDATENDKNSDGGSNQEEPDAGPVDVPEAKDDAGPLDAGGEMADGGGGGTNASIDCEPTGEIPSLIEEDTTVGPGCLSMQTTRIASGVRLTIAPGTTVLVGSAGELTNSTSGNGTVVAVGTAEEPIVFQPEDPEAEAGAWHCIFINDEGAGSRLEWVTIDRAGVDCGLFGTPEALSLESGVAVANVLVKNSKNYGIHFRGEPPVRFENNTFENNAKPSLKVTGDAVPVLGSGHKFLTPGDSIEVSGNAVTGTWSDHGVPYLLPTGLSMASAAALTLDPGVELRMGSDSFGETDGTIRAIGTADAPIRFRSAQASPAAGDWGCVQLGVSSRLEHVIIEHGGNGAGCTVFERRTAVYADGPANILSTEVRDVTGAAIMSGLDCDDTATASQWCSETTLENVATTPAITCSGGTTDLCAE